MTRKEKKQLVELIHSETNKGKIVIYSCEGMFTADSKDFIKQPVDDILYDLNRDEMTVLTLSRTHIRWVNDFAVACTIRALKARIDELESKITSK